MLLVVVHKKMSDAGAFETYLADSAIIPKRTSSGICSDSNSDKKLDSWNKVCGAL